MVRGRMLGLAVICAAAVSAVGVAAAPGAPAATLADATVATAPGAPGAASYFDLARKDCVGTAANRVSKVWYTVADGVLSDVYEPTVDNTDVSTLQYIVTDGSTFSDLQTRDMTYTVRADPTGMACTVTSTDAKHGFRLVTTSSGAQVPVVFSTNTITNAANRDYAVPTYMALDASAPPSAASVGYEGTASDGLTQLDSSHTLTSYTSAPDGHQARAFTATPGAYSFGVCAVGGTAPICSVPASTVPKALDVITPPGVSQATELNPVPGPVVIQPVVVP